MYFQPKKFQIVIFFLDEIDIFSSYPKMQNWWFLGWLSNFRQKRGPIMPTYMYCKRDKWNLTFKTFTNLILSSKRHHHEILPHRSAQIPCYLTNLNATFLRQICLLISQTTLLCFVGLLSKVTVILMRKKENMYCMGMGKSTYLCMSAR